MIESPFEQWRDWPQYPTLYTVDRPVLVESSALPRVQCSSRRGQFVLLKMIVGVFKRFID